MTTLAKIKRTITAAIRAARQEGAHVVEVTIGDGEATVRIPLAASDDDTNKPIAEPEEVIL